MDQLEETIRSMMKKVDTLVERDKQLENERKKLTEEITNVRTKLSELIDILKLKKKELKQHPNPITPYISTEKINQEDQFWCISKLSDNRIAGGCFSGDIYIYKYSIVLKKFELLLYKSNAHSKGIYIVNEISKNKLISSGRDSAIKLWDISKPKEIKILKQYMGHTDDVYQVVYINHNEKVQHLVSCSFWDGSLRLWNVNDAKNSELLYCDKDNPPRSLVHLKERNYLFVSIVNQENKEFGQLMVYKTNPSGCENVKTIENVFTNWRYGLVGISKDYVLVSKDKPESKIFLIDVEKLEIVDEIMDKEFIKEQGSLDKLKENIALYVRKGKFFQVRVKKQQDKDKTAKMIMEYKKEYKNFELKCGGGVVVIDDKHFVTNNLYEQLTIYELNY